MTVSSKRPEQVAWASLVVSLIFFGVAFFLGRWSEFSGVAAVGWQVLAAALIWLVLAIQFHQRALAEQEKLDLGQLARDKNSATIFQARGEQAALFAAAQRRLDVLEKWFVPVFAALIAVYEFGLGLYLFPAVTSSVSTQKPLVCAIIMTGVAFVSFLMSRYATGMSAEPRWKELRAGGSYFLAVALVCFALAVALALVHFQIFALLAVVNYIVPALLVVLGVETALNLVLDIYRPRLKGQYNRAAFDSRLLGVINEPGGIFRSVATAIDYQFGFQVSQTWFYKLLEKAIVPLVLFSVVTLYLASSIEVVAPDEEAIVERFGSPRNAQGQVRHLAPGLHLKLPWPIDRTYRHPTRRIMELYIGYEPKKDPKTGEIIPETKLLWGQAHYEKEHDLLVAARYTAKEVGQELAEGALPVGMVKANIPVHYRIKDLYAYVYQHRDPAKLLEAICYRELARFASSATLEVDDPGIGQEMEDDSLLGPGRAKARVALTKGIQAAADEAGLGVEVVFVGLQGLHPPAEVAPDYQAVIGAVQKKQALVLEAEAQRNQSLSTLVGSVAEAGRLASLAAEYQAAQTEGRTEDVERLGRQFDAAFAAAKGDISRILSEAQSYAFSKVALARAKGEQFAGQLKAYQAAPEIYKNEHRMAVLEEVLPNIRKYVVVANPNDNEVVIVDLQEKPATSLYDLGGIEESSPK